jgi:hypothetical protein
VNLKDVQVSDKKIKDLKGAFKMPEYTETKSRSVDSASSTLGPLSNETEILIVQNILDGPLHISDLNLSLEPRECWEINMTINRDKVANSRNLRQAILKGYLITLSEREYEEQLEKEQIRQLQSMLPQENYKGSDISIDIDTGERLSRRTQKRTVVSEEELIEQLDQLNNPFIYAKKYKEAKEELGVDPHEFSEMVKRGEIRQGNRGRRFKVGSETYNAWRDTKSRATVLESDPQGYETVGRKAPMYNINRDYTGGEDDFAEQIDMTSDLR